MLAPVCFFAYNRVKEVRISITALQSNKLSLESDLFIFSDGPKSEIDVVKVNEVRRYINNLSGFKSVTVFESKVNKGLANSIISGVTQIIKKYGKVIVLEDDLISAPNFLDFMNQALDFFEDNRIIFSISGYSLDLPSLKNYPYDFYLGYRASSWGWGTWKDRWNNIDWEVKDYSSFRLNPMKQIQFMRGGSDLPGMLKNQMNGKIDSWAIRWCYDQFNKKMLTVFPAKSKIISIGFGLEATHTKKTFRFNSKLDQSLKTNFTLHSNAEINRKLVKEFRQKFSIISRLKDKLSGFFIR